MLRLAEPFTSDKSWVWRSGSTKLKLHALKEFTVYKLEDFVGAQREQAAVAQEKLEQLHSATLESVESVCHEALEALQKYLDSTGLGEPAEDPDAIVPTPVKAQPYEYTVRSQKRTEHMRLRKFVKLIELMTRDTLSSIVVDSAADVRDFLEKPRAVDDIDKIDELIKNTGKDEEEEAAEPEEEPEAEDGDQSPRSLGCVPFSALLLLQRVAESIL